MTLDTIVVHLERLARMNEDSARGLTQAAESIRSEPIARLLRQMAQDRRHHVRELRSFVPAAPERVGAGSLAARLHRWWLSARAILSGGGEHAILAEVERGEDAIKRRYEAALRCLADSRSAAQNLILRQYLEIKRAHDVVRGLRDVASLDRSHAKPSSR